MKCELLTAGFLSGNFTNRLNQAGFFVPDAQLKIGGVHMGDKT